MKTGIALFALLAAVISVQAQEYDDMYFRSKDRVKLNGERVSLTSTTSTLSDASAVQSTINPTDSYSGRGTNPEYTSRTKVNSNTDEDAQYFVSGYEPTGVNQSLSAYNNGSFYSPYYGNSAFSNSYYGYGSGFGYPYSSFYSPYSSFYSPGMSLGMGSMWGMGMGSGFYGSMGLGYGSMWGSPYSSMMYGGYYGYNSFYGSGFGYPYYGYGYGMGYGGYYPSVVVINNNNDGRSGYVYGKRGSRSSDISNQMYNGSNRSSSSIVDSHGRTRGAAANIIQTSSSGRSSGNSQYYHSGWRSNPDVQRNIGGSNAGRNSSWGNSSGWSNSSGRSSSTWGGNSNSGFNNSGSFGGSRSSGGFSGGSFGGGGHTGGGGGRGRH